MTRDAHRDLTVLVIRKDSHPDLKSVPRKDAARNDAANDGTPMTASRAVLGSELVNRMDARTRAATIQETNPHAETNGMSRTVPGAGIP